MKEASDITVCVRDHGLFLGLAEALAPQVKRVIYQPTWEEGFPTINRHVIGDGFKNFEWCEDFWPIKHEIDLFVFPDLGFAGLQNELVNQGFAVWGSRNGEKIETDRELFHHLLAELELPVPKYEVVTGLTNLALYLQDKEEQFVKISKWRGSMETWKWQNWDVSRGKLDSLAVKFGPQVKEHVRFLVVDKIESELEVGADTYAVRGRFPQRMIQGWEWKDRAYLGTFQDAKDFPPQLSNVIDAFSPILEQSDYTNLFSIEVRGDKFQDPCCRFPCPGSGAQFSLLANLAKIMWAGANGELLEPEEAAVFAAECIMTTKGDKESWGSVRMPDELRQWVSCGNCCEIDGVLCFPPDGEDSVGWIRATGDTIPETLDNLYEHVEMLPDGVEADTDAFVDLLKEIREAEKQGIEFTEQTVPQPESALNV